MARPEPTTAAPLKPGQEDEMRWFDRLLDPEADIFEDDDWGNWPDLLNDEVEAIEAQAKADIKLEQERGSQQRQLERLRHQQRENRAWRKAVLGSSQKNSSRGMSYGANSTTSGRCGYNGGNTNATPNNPDGSDW